jgi:hypothetical protein
MPSVAAIAVKLWPAPTVLTVRPLSAANRTIDCTSATLVGRAVSTGYAASERPQLRQIDPGFRDAGRPVAIVTGTPGPLRGR